MNIVAKLSIYYASLYTHDEKENKDFDFDLIWYDLNQRLQKFYLKQNLLAKKLLFFLEETHNF